LNRGKHGKHGKKKKIHHEGREDHEGEFLRAYGARLQRRPNVPTPS
jgi:hypothetical protein